MSSTVARATCDGVLGSIEPGRTAPTARLELADISHEVGAALLVDTAVSTFGGVDLVVNNAGILRRESHWSASADHWGDTFRTNVEGPWW